MFNVPSMEAFPPESFFDPQAVKSPKTVRSRMVRNVSKCELSAEVVVFIISNIRIVLMYCKS